MLPVAMRMDFALSSEGAPGIHHRDAPDALDSAAAVIAGNLVLLEKRIHATGQGRDDLFLAAEHGGQIQGDLGGANAVLGEVVPG